MPAAVLYHLTLIKALLDKWYSIFTEVKLKL